MGDCPQAGEFSAPRSARSEGHGRSDRSKTLGKTSHARTSAFRKWQVALAGKPPVPPRESESTAHGVAVSPVVVSPTALIAASDKFALGGGCEQHGTPASHSQNEFLIKILWMLWFVDRPIQNQHELLDRFDSTIRGSIDVRNTDARRRLFPSEEM
jgi:hypothetical protein